MRSVEELAQVTSPTLRRFAGVLRRMAVSVTTRPSWQVIGYRTPDAGDETAFAEVFPGVGFYSRPPRSGAPEAVVAYVGGASHPVVVATRDEKTRAKVAVISEDEAIVFSTRAVVHVRANGTVEIRTRDGIAVPLATKADVAALKAHVDQHRHQHAAPGGTALTTYPTSTPTGTPVPDLAPAPAGTTVLRGE
jgi:phage gp45-like